jgi:hypothetical protein
MDQPDADSHAWGIAWSKFMSDRRTEYLRSLQQFLMGRYEIMTDADKKFLHEVGIQP